MQPKLIDKINGMKTIELSDRDSLGIGSSAEVFRYMVGDTEVALKCFEKESAAQQEHALYEKILSKVSCCPGIMQYYGMKKLQIS